MMRRNEKKGKIFRYICILQQFMPKYENTFLITYIALSDVNVTIPIEKNRKRKSPT